jgi:hypothetical protein
MLIACLLITSVYHLPFKLLMLKLNPTIPKPLGLHRKSTSCLPYITHPPQPRLEQLTEEENLIDGFWCLRLWVCCIYLVF